MTRRLTIVLVLGAILVAGSAALSRSGSGLASPQAASAGCKKVGWIAEHPKGTHAYLRLAGCKCPAKGCSRVAKEQDLYANETMFSGAGGKITFKSVGKGVPNLKCIVSSNSKNVIYPQASDGPEEEAVLQVISGATSCQVGTGQFQPGKKNAVFIVNNTRLTVYAIEDPVFGIKAVANGSLIQVRKGEVTVAASAGRDKTVGPDKQIVVSEDGNSVSGATSKLDPTLKPGLCALTPELSLTKVKAASGAHPGGHPLGLAPDRSGKIWFTDDVTPAVGLFNPINGKITYR